MSGRGTGRGRALAHAIDAGVLAKPSLLGGTGESGGAEPLWVSRAHGAHLWDADGRRFLDLLLGFGSVVLGHAHPAVTEAVVDAVRAGVSPSLRSVLERELVDLLSATIPNAETVLLLKTGSDATAAAVRAARAHTGRPRVIRWGYQGWHDWCAPRGAGVPADYHRLTTVVPLGDLATMREAFAADGSWTAAVVVMPGDAEYVDREALLECRRLADRYGSLFVLDEVRTSFRLSLGGAQEYFDVDADLVASSKAMANGHAISALTGRSEVMSVLADVSVSSVFFRSTDGMAAALATVRTLRDTDALDRVWARGRELLDGMAAAAGRTGAPVRPVGLPPTPYHRFDLAGAELQRAEQTFYETVWAEGLLLSRTHHWFTCADMTRADIGWALEVIEHGYRAVARSA
ncbi:MAG: aminotransferase class III-fold pyridoxal phosphate-dependent enzyme [Pseudonocardia sp.]